MAYYLKTILSLFISYRKSNSYIFKLKVEFDSLFMIPGWKLILYAPQNS
jgi:hypothetical protein